MPVMTLVVWLICTYWGNHVGTVGKRTIWSLSRPMSGKRRLMADCHVEERSKLTVLCTTNAGPDVTCVTGKKCFHDYFKYTWMR